MKRYTTGISYWTRQQKRGVLGLVCCCILLQVAYFVIDIPSPTIAFSQENLIAFQQRIDSLKAQEKAKQYTISPFNPNFISDYKAYILGISAQELSRLQVFRETGKYVNSAKEFQEVTGVSDSLLATIAPLFKFPDWVKNRKTTAYNYQDASSKHFPKQDINTATAEALMKIYGIGEGFSNRILKYKEKLQGFTYIDQVAEVYGLEKEVYERVAARFEVKTPPVIVKKDLNAISRYDLSKIPYIKYGESNKIIGLRSEVGMFKHLDDLLQIEGFDEARIRRLALYLYVGN